MNDTYKKLCRDGNFDIAELILHRYKLDLSEWHSDCILMLEKNQSHYEYCRRNNIRINYTGKIPHLYFLDTTPPHPEMNTIRLNIICMLHIMFPKMKSECYNTIPPRFNQIIQLQNIFKDQLHFSPKDIFDNKKIICDNYDNIDIYKFIVFIIKNMDQSDVYNIIRALFQQNNCIFISNIRSVFRILITSKKNQLINLIDFFFPAPVFVPDVYKISIGKSKHVFGNRKLVNKIYL